MNTLAWHYSNRLYRIKDLADVYTGDLADVDSLWHLVSLDFIDGSRLIFNLLNRQREVIDFNNCVAAF